jgi:plasmid stabilization system protein ParE
MKIIWSGFASKMLYEIYEYYEKAAGKAIASRIKSNIFHATQQLREQKYLGHTDLVLEKLKEGHRFLVTGNYKIVYKIVKEGILITDVFDVRQDPNKINDSSR